MEQKTNCPDCTGEEKRHFFSHYCALHDVCISCGIGRDKITDVPWATRKGSFQCKPCEKGEREARIADRKKKGFDHEYTDEIVCPHCGYEHADSWEAQNSGKQECAECETEFSFERIIECTYKTDKEAKS